MNLQIIKLYKYIQSAWWRWSVPIIVFPIQIETHDNRIFNSWIIQHKKLNLLVQLSLNLTVDEKAWIESNLNNLKCFPLVNTDTLIHPYLVEFMFGSSNFVYEYRILFIWYHNMELSSTLFIIHWKWNDKFLFLS